MWEFLVADPFEFAGERINLKLIAFDERECAALFSIESPDVLGATYEFIVLEGSRLPAILRSLAVDCVECGACPLREGVLSNNPKWGAEKWRGGLLLKGTLRAERVSARR